MRSGQAPLYLLSSVNTWKAQARRSRNLQAIDVQLLAVRKVPTLAPPFAEYPSGLLADPRLPARSAQARRETLRDKLARKLEADSPASTLG